MSTEQYLIYLLKSFLNEKTDVIPPPESVSLEKLYQLCQKHNVAAIAYAVLRLADMDEELLTKFKDAMVGAVYRNTVLDSMISEVLDQFESFRIPYAILKGYRLKQDYPVPEFRTMGDVDFLIKEEHRMEADRLLLAMGYEKDWTMGSTWTYKMAGTTLEIHTKPAFGNYWNQVNYEGYFLKFFSRLNRRENTYEMLLSGEDHFIFLLFHLAKHLNSSGAGIRMILDLAVVLKKHLAELDWKYIKEELQSIRLLEFSEHIFDLCAELFEVEVPFHSQQTDEKLQKQLLAYILQGGIFGFERPDSIRRLRNGIRAGNISGDRRIQISAGIKLLFPGRKHMAAFLPAVEKHVWMLPLAWIRRWKMGLKYRDRVEHSLSGFTENVEEARSQYLLLKRIGL